jgi:hypothetical protein
VSILYIFPYPILYSLRGGGKKRKKKNYSTPKKPHHKKKKVKLAVLKYYKVSPFIFFVKQILNFKKWL